MQPSSQARKVSINTWAESLWCNRIKTNKEYEIQNYLEAEVRPRGYNILSKGHCIPDFFQKQPKILITTTGFRDWVKKAMPLLTL